jgi:methyl-accepting chemotaxis protein
MADGRDLLREWQDAMQSIVSSAKGAAGRSEIPRQLLAPMQRQVELLQEVIDRERRLQSELFGHLFAPVDAVFDLLEQSGAALRQQSQALEEASRALEQTAALMTLQAELFEKTIRTMREPTELAKAAAGVEPRAAGKAGAKKRSRR